MSRILALTALPLAIAVLVGCGTKVDPDLPVSDMTSEDWINFCDWSASTLEDVDGDHDCDGVTRTIDSQDLDECIAEGELMSGSTIIEECGLLAGDMEECINAQADDPCVFLDPDGECAVFLECLYGAAGGPG